jgi:chorismate-pyruvate lyase
MAEFNLLAELQNNSALTQFQKVLLATDGTVTDLVALYTGESIVAQKVAHELAGQFKDRPPALVAANDARLLRREIVLVGVRTQQAYLHAESFFVFDRFSDAMQQALRDSDAPIGLLWKRDRLEMFREVIDVRLQTNPKIAGCLGVEPDTLLVSRSYLIHHDRMHLGLICETFATTQFRD